MQVFDYVRVLCHFDSVCLHVYCSISRFVNCVISFVCDSGSDGKDTHWNPSCGCNLRIRLETHQRHPGAIAVILHVLLNDIHRQHARNKQIRPCLVWLKYCSV